MAKYKNPVPSLDDDFKVRKTDLEPIVNNYTPNKSVYFAFIDVLGFKQAFDDNRLRNDNEIEEKFEKVFTYYSDLMNSANFLVNTLDNKECCCYAGQTSDSLYFYTDRADYLINFLKIFSHLNVYAMTEDVFFRGGIANGNLYYKRKYQYYGESVINAYLLESEIAKNPIVVIDESTYNAIKKFPECDLLTFDCGNRHCLHPFAWLENNFVLDIISTKEIKEIDYSLVEKKIRLNKAKFEYDDKTYNKYVFLEGISKKIQHKIGG